MLVEAGRFLRHAGHRQEWCDDRYREDVFHCYGFSPAFVRKALDVRSR